METPGAIPAKQLHATTGIPQKGKNGPTATPRATLSGIGEYGDIWLKRNYTQITTSALLLLLLLFYIFGSFVFLPILISPHFPAFDLPLPRHVTPTGARAANRIHRGSLRNRRRLADFSCTGAPEKMDQSHHPVQ